MPPVAMNERSEGKCDRKLFSELLEPPIHPLLIHIVPPFIEENNPMFIKQMYGEAAWRLREVSLPPHKVFELLQTSIMPLGYRQTESSCDRVGRTIGENIRRFKRRTETIINGKRKEKNIRSETWIKITINPEEIKQSPTDCVLIYDTIRHDGAPAEKIRRFIGLQYFISDLHIRLRVRD